ncbi:hypothetical protein [Klebsiella variicola]|uniref:hypothetical protein n=1 Tax=Klebsiella variicola TaxID=244366 RepID=UPI002181971F|nr:hypothetical protein [Klebsiella variicola]GKL54962.1 hypothetical protein NUKP61_25200 [Klebsiella variicola]HCI8762174.1 hypothetical protein [Klebsiella variicola]
MAFDPPLGSTSPAVLLDNATRLDKLLNSQELTVPDRSGEALKSWTGIESDLAEKLALIDAIVASLDSAGVITVPDIATGLAATSNGQYFRVIMGDGNSKSFTYYRSINSAAMEITSLASDAFSAQLNSLAETTQFYSASAGDEYELPEGLGPVRIDGKKEFIDYILNGVLHSIVPGAFPKLTAGEIIVGGKSIDPDGVLEKDAGENLTRLSNSSQFFGGEDDEIELGDNPFVRTDAEGHIIFDNLEYLNKKNNWDEAYEKSKNVEPQKINPLIPFTQTDAAGKSQVRVFNTETNREYAVTAGQSNETDVRPEGLDRIVWKSDRVDTAPGGLFYAKSPEFTEHPYISRSVLVGWGDSFMENVAFMNKLAELTGLYGYNFGKSSQQSTGVVAKQGGARAYYIPAGGVIPESGSIVLSPAVPGPLAAFGWAALSSISVIYVGVAGMFGWDGSVATFTRTAPGESILVPVLMPVDVIPTTTQAVKNGAPAGTVYQQHHECINVLTMGRNNISQTDMIMTNVHQYIARLTPVGIRPLICSQFPAADEPTGSSNNSAVLRLNQRLLEEVPEFYTHIDGLDMLQNFKNHLNPNFVGDVSDVSNGLTPRTLRYDGLHPAQKVQIGATGNGNSLSPENALYVGAEVNAKFAYEVMKLKGWVK